MKNRFISFALILLSSHFAFAQSKNLSSELLSAYKSAFYPGVVRTAEEILRTEKNSLARFRAAVYEGESLYRMGRIQDSVSILEKHFLNADKSNPESVLLNSSKYYWLGRGYFSSGELEKAQKEFFSSASFFRELEQANPKYASFSSDYYSLSVLYGAKCFVAASDFKNAIPLFEYVVSNGKKFNSEDYSDSAVSLVQCYNFSGGRENSEKCVSVTSQLEAGSFDDDTKYSLLILKGEALENLGEFKKSYDTYCTVIKNAPPHLAAAAMQKAYAVSSVHREVVTPEVGEVLSQAEYRLAQYPSLLSEFWTRLAVDAFNSKDYQKSLSYFKEASENASSSQKEIAALYKAEIAYITGEDKNKAAKEALGILEESAKTKSGGKNEMILIALSRFNGYLKNWKKCEEFARKCLKSEDSEIEKNAVYWLALSQYERGDSKSSVETIGNYSKDVKITDKSLLTLYAKSLAKQGKYHDADVIFYSLGEKNQLDNDGRLDYSRTLLIAGHYVSTKEQAAKAKGDEAVYLSSLANFNQRKWSEAEKGFSKIQNSKTLTKDYAAYSKFYCGYAQYQLGKYADAEAVLSRFAEENPLHKFVWSANMTAARSAAFTKNEAAAINHAQKAVKTSRTEDEKNEAVILLAGILQDSKKYDEALSLLNPHTGKKSKFGYECKYRTAEILFQKGDYPSSDRCFSELANLSDKEAALISEESAYRRAENAYSLKDFAKSAELFEEYSKKWADGRFKFQAVYFSADSLAKTGDDTRAILRYLQITDSKAETSYRYISEKNLIELYEKTGDYASALNMARKMLDEYGKQAVNDGIAKKEAELKKNTGKNSKSVDEEISSAEKELAKNRNNSVMAASNMKNAVFLAEEYRKKGANRKSAEMFLEAVKHSRIAGNDETAERSFYGAVESFDAAGLYADSKAAYTEMKKLYPQSAYTKKAGKIVEN
ncbi:MAG: tetratricopeptide repeat protein [Treponema sp.]|nr:tetratricopeptide repeat protein [Treponema sp.]